MIKKNAIKNEKQLEHLIKLGYLKHKQKVDLLECLLKEGHYHFPTNVRKRHEFIISLMEKIIKEEREKEKNGNL